MITTIFLSLLQCFLHISSIVILFISICYVFNILNFIKDAVESNLTDDAKLGVTMLFAFLFVATLINIMLFKIIW